MSDPIHIPNKAKPEPSGTPFEGESLSTNVSSPNADYLSTGDAYRSAAYSSPTTPRTPGLSRTTSFSGMSAVSDDIEEAFPPLDRLTMFDVLENLALPQRLEKIQNSIYLQRDKVRRQQEKLKSTGLSAKDKVVEEWRRRVPTPDEQLQKYRKRMRENVDRLGKSWSDAKTVTVKEKVSFIAGVLNIFISGYLIGAYPEWFHYWYTAQLCYFMPIRWYTYHKIGYHYFLADLCYFVNLLMVLVIWFFPSSKRLFISTYCLAFGNNAVAIAMWRNSLVFHSLDKVTSLFIHIMPCATLHCLIHLIPKDLQAEKFPAIYNIIYSAPSSPEHYSLGSMIVWATVPYAVWQLSYHFMITVRRREKIAAGRPTSFTWLRKSYRNNFLGKFVLSLPDPLQEPAFMLIQYSYALLTMIPCPIWFWYRWASASFLMIVFTWATYNGATFYIDVFGRKYEKELESLRKEVQKWQSTPEGRTLADHLSPPTKAEDEKSGSDGKSHGRTKSVDNIPLLDEKEEAKTTARVEEEQTQPFKRS
ncbi:hypothetical protein M8818_006170 [Zalaria obscura]|uniref:Uncharacterized protein n=1 Tax=Zalaria obscura TaxID=2024903 RepID=A0ACC3S757_9PEZI